jgi:ABC-type bacteriocin/lantibiotic exporter with double-glycine peptidase domain
MNRGPHMSQNRKIPEELSILTDLYEDEADKNAIRHAFYTSATGDPNTQPVQFAVLLSANAQLMKVYPGRLKKLLEFETQKLATAIGAQLAVVKESAATILSASQATQNEVDALREEARRQRAELEHAINDIMHKADLQGRGVADAASSVTREVKWFKSASVTWFWSFVGLAFALGAAMVFIIDHFTR